MAGIGKHDSSSLRNLLDEFIDVHKNDVLELTSGHLNESKLWNPMEANREPWTSARKPPIRLKSASKLQTQSVRRDHLPPLEVKKKHMTEAVMDFMLGPSGGIGFSERRKNTSPGGPISEPSFINKEMKIPSDHNLTQELDLPELMLPVFRSRRRHGGRQSPKVKHEFIRTHHSLPTKSDQFKKMKEFEDLIINKKMCQERKTASSVKVVDRIEKKLRKKLSSLEARFIVKRVPSFYTLQAYSETWNEVIECSEIYGNVLRIIKDEFDAYISLLLDLQETQNSNLFQHLNSLSEESTEMTQRVKDEEEKVNELEKLAMKALQENESLREQMKEQEKIKEERLKFEIPDRSKQSLKDTHIGEKKKDLEEKVEDLHRQIEDQLKSLESLKLDRKENYVPVIVCRRMEQCIKETEHHIQKLLKQNGFLENTIENVEAYLEDLIEEKGTNERDARFLWMKINTSQVVDSQNRQQSISKR